ncbi:hypothetical protein PR048_022372 [Dryococelus australis]|uniref:Uncharacterized protein n=1 Tax=Dryococelus australis TaxID=614101 RepID=A0ABQ9H141_9NEOP|nr:hypothetical protein PR048_022372 [Dryococelus australis]
MSNVLFYENNIHFRPAPTLIRPGDRFPRRSIRRRGMEEDKKVERGVTLGNPSEARPNGTAHARGTASRCAGPAVSDSRARVPRETSQRLCRVWMFISSRQHGAVGARHGAREGENNPHVRRSQIRNYFPYIVTNFPGRMPLRAPFKINAEIVAHAQNCHQSARAPTRARVVVVYSIERGHVNFNRVISNEVIASDWITLQNVTSPFPFWCITCRSDFEGNGRAPRKPAGPAASSGTTPTCENPGEARPRIEHGSSWWEASSLTAPAPRRQRHVDSEIVTRQRRMIRRENSSYGLRDLLVVSRGKMGILGQDSGSGPGGVKATKVELERMKKKDEIIEYDKIKSKIAAGNNMVDKITTRKNMEDNMAAGNKTATMMSKVVGSGVPNPGPLDNAFHRRHNASLRPDVNWEAFKMFLLGRLQVTAASDK